MQNLSNYSNSHVPQQRNPAFTSIQHLQNYITQLTLYINQTNHKYNKNMHTLKQFYQSQIGQLQSERNQMGQEIGALNNQLNAAKDIIANNNIRIRQLEGEVNQARQDADHSREKLMSQRRKIDQMYQQMTQLRQNCQLQVEKSSKKIIGLEEEISILTIRNKQKDSEIHSLKEQVFKLQDQLSERYSLPQKVKEIEKDNQKLKTALSINKQRLIEIESKMDFNQAELDKYRKENESLRIMKGKFNAQKSLQIEKTIKQQKENAEHRIKRLQTENQSYIYQLNESQNQLKAMKKEIQQLQVALNKEVKTIKEYEKEVQIVNQNKDAYIAQFGSLKTQYEGVIHRLEDSLIDYQKKNWNLQQQNQDLNHQLESLQELLTELKAINNMQPARRQYRKLAEMQVIASRPISVAVENAVNKKEVELPFQSDYANDWQKLLQDIQKIKI